MSGKRLNDAVEAPLELPQLPLGWCWTTLGELLDGIQAGKSFKCDTRKATAVEWGVIKVSAMTWGEFDEEENKAIPPNKEIDPHHEIRTGDILLSRSNTVELVGATVLVRSCRPRLVLSDKSMRLLVPQAINRGWLQKMLSGPPVRRQLSAVATGTSDSMRNVSQEKVLAVRLLLPPASEQTRILTRLEELLSDLEAGVACLERARDNLKKYRAAVLKAAVTGELTKEWRANHRSPEPSHKPLDRALAARQGKWARETAFPATTILPELPPGWCWVSVGQLLREPTCNGISVKGSNEPPGVPALRLSAMSEVGFDYSERRYIPISDELADELRVREGDFFVARGNGSLHLVGRGTLAQQPEDVVVFPDTMIRVRLLSDVALGSFVNLAWASRLLRRQIEKRARTTAGIYKISQRDVEALVLPLPPLDEQQQVVRETAEQLSLIAATGDYIEASLKRAERLRQSILKEAFAGRLVPQDPKDEPASVLLDRIRQTRSAEETVAPTRSRAPRKKTSQKTLFEE